MKLSSIVKSEGVVTKTFINTFADARYKNELKVLKHLNKLDCNFCPKLISWDNYGLSITMEDCGENFDVLESNIQWVREELKKYNVIHYDLRASNLVKKNDWIYVIDFESCRIF
jgi:PPM family protein phosphatase